MRPMGWFWIKKGAGGMCPDIKTITKDISQHGVAMLYNIGGNYLICYFLVTPFISCCIYFCKDRIAFLAYFFAEDVIANIC